METIKLKGKDLYDYFVNKKDGYAGIVSLLAYHNNIEEAYSVLERSITEGKKLVAVYPGGGDIATSDMEYVCEIEDGALYLQ